MWIFLPGGLLMPSVVPEGKGDPVLTNNGLWMMQVRAREKSHLENFIRDYMEDGTYSDIEHTPQMDYNYRFYTTHEHLALAVAKSVLDIDYAKFKPTAERKDKDGQLLYKDGKKYHTVLNAIWSNVCQLGSPGGYYGALSKSNPNGYSSASEYYQYYSKPKGTSTSRWWDDEAFDHETGVIGASFFDRELSYDDIEAWEDEQAVQDTLATASEVIETMKDAELSVSSWFPFLTKIEESALRAYAENCLNLRKSDLTDTEQEVVAHFFGEGWDSIVPDPVSAVEGTPPFEKMTTTKTQRRRRNRKNRRQGKTSRGVTF